MPWILCGDFNSALGTAVRIGSPVTQQETQGFQNMVDHIQLTLIRATGWHFTWSNKQEVENRVYSKIAWAFGNLRWIQQYGHEVADYLNPSASDHSPILIKCSQQKTLHPRPFRFEHLRFKEVLQNTWR